MTISSNYVRAPALTLWEVLPDYPVNNIMIRTNDPSGSDTLLGYYRWDGEEIIPLAGSICWLTETVLKYELPDYGPVDMICWIHSDWIKLKEES